MSEDTELQTESDDGLGLSVQQRVVMLPPYVAEEHRQLLEDAEKALENYSEMLLAQIKKELFDYSPAIQPHPRDIQEAERVFFDDPVRQQMLRNLSEIKLLVERPRLLVTAT